MLWIFFNPGMSRVFDYVFDYGFSVTFMIFAVFSGFGKITAKPRNIPIYGASEVFTVARLEGLEPPTF